MAWASSYYADCDFFLEATFEAAKKIMLETGVGEQLYLEVKRLRLPASHKNGGYQIWHSGRTDEEVNQKLPVSIPPLLQPKEEKLITRMLEELRSNLALDVDTSPSFDRGLGPQAKVKQAVDFLIVGSSNASKLANCLSRLGYATYVIFEPNWRISSGNVDSLAQKIGEAIIDVDPAVVVLQLLDNSCYFGRASDGSRTPAKKGIDGKYHLEGDVTICAYDTQLEHIKALKGILDAVNKRTCLLVTPLPCYVTAGCFLSPEHCSNRRYQDFRQHLMASLELLRKNFKDFLFYDGRRNVKVLDPCVDVRHLPDDEIWGDDPIHPKESAFEKIAASVAKIGLREGEKRARTDSMEAGASAGPDARRGRRDTGQGIERGREYRGRGRMPRGQGWRGARGGQY
jgi:hypothetical protein